MSVGCAKKAEAKKSDSHAKVEAVPDETQLAKITLSEDAERSLKISVVPVEVRAVQRHRSFGGELMIPPGKSIIVATPVAGVIGSDLAKGLPLPGATLNSGDAVLSVTPMLSPERDVPTPAEQVQMAGVKATLVAAQVTAQGDIQRANADSTAGRINLDRARKLLADRAGSQRAVDDAQAILNVAEATLMAANERYKQLSSLLKIVEKNPGGDPASELKIHAPVSGIVRNLNVSMGQQVVAGATLFEVLDTSSLWVRVPVYVDLLSSIQVGAAGKIMPLSGVPLHDTIAKSPMLAKSIQAPPTADATSSSADLYFEVPNTDFSLRPGQRVGIELPMSDEVEAKVVPAASVLYDLYGGSWVYVSLGQHQFQRTRVSVLWFENASAILQSGPNAGIPVVVDGAAELFGTEFGAGK